MANISAYGAISSGNAVLASVVSDNFTKIAAAVNSNALNSQNYGQSAILSQHISTAAIQSQHISNSAVVSAHIGNNAIQSQHISNSVVQSNHIEVGAIRQNHMIYKSSDSGVRIVQIGDVASNMPAGGVRFSRITAAISQSDTVKVPVTYVYSNVAVDGDPGFTADPILAGNPIFQFGATSDEGPYRHAISAIDSISVVIVHEFSGSQVATGTVNFGVLGPIA